MRYFSFLLLPFACCLGYGAAPVQEPELPAATLDYDQQVSMLKEQIAKYEGLALAFDRKAQRLQDRDFTEYRRALTMREECRGIADDLKKHLNELEKQRNPK